MLLGRLQMHDPNSRRAYTMPGSTPPSSPLPAGREKLTFVLPLRGARDLESTRLNLLPSLDRFFDVEDIEELLVIGRADELRTFDFSDVVSAPLAARIRALDERDLLPPDRGWLPLGGYDRQQVLKLTVSGRVRTRLYCTLDADVYLVRPCGLSDWWSDGRCVYNPVSMDVYPRWWRAAAKHLGYPLDFDRSHGFGVTPALLYTQIVSELVAFLEKDRKGVAHAVRHRATEYSLYWLFLLKNHSRQALYSEEAPHLMGNAVWRASDVGPEGVRAFVDRQFAPGGDYFMTVLQSTSRLADPSVLEYIQGKIRNGAPAPRAPAPNAREGAKPL
jgi:hypothetical protein